MLYYERKLLAQGCDLIIGVDEAGRGPLAGPVVAAAVSLSGFRFHHRIDDSKKLSASQREKAFFEISKKCVFAIGIISEKQIDRINILEATRLAMRQAIAQLVRKVKTGGRRVHVIVDGNMRLDIPHQYTSIVKGDAKSKSIAAASILAKVTRDRMMEAYDLQYPQYNFRQNKGYPTREHRLILKQIGPSEIHRKSFSCV